MDKSELNPKALGYTFTFAGIVLYAFLWILSRYSGTAILPLRVLSSVIFSGFPSVVWLVLELIQIAAISFLGGYLIAYVYNRLS